MEDWKKDLSDFFKKLEEKKHRNEEEITQKESEADRFFSTVVAPALEELKVELEKHGRKVFLGAASISVEFEGKDEFSYTIEISQKGNFPYAESYWTEKVDGKSYRSKDYLAFEHKAFSDVSKEDIIRNFLGQYKQHVGGYFLD